MSSYRSSDGYQEAALRVILDVCDSISQVVRTSTSDAINALADDKQETIGRDLLSRERYIHKELCHIQQLAQSLYYS